MISGHFGSGGGLVVTVADDGPVPAPPLPGMGAASSPLPLPLPYSQIPFVQ